jgi:hypothetical protein
MGRTSWRPELVDKAFAARYALAEHRGDSRSPVAAHDRARRSSEALVARARTEVEHAITDGLRARNGFLLVPPMIIEPKMMRDLVVYTLALAIRAALALPTAIRHRGGRKAWPFAERAPQCSCRTAGRPASSAAFAASGRLNPSSSASARSSPALAKPSARPSSPAG